MKAVLRGARLALLFETAGPDTKALRPGDEVAGGLSARGSIHY